MWWNMPYLPQLQSTIHTMDNLLDEMGNPVHNFDRHLLYIENIRRIKDMLLELYTNPMYIDARMTPMQKRLKHP